MSAMCYTNDNLSDFELYTARIAEVQRLIDLYYVTGYLGLDRARRAITDLELWSRLSTTEPFHVQLMRDLVSVLLHIIHELEQ